MAETEAQPPLPPLPPDTTEQADLVVAGQRRINIIWEVTQAIIAVGVTGSIVYCAIAAKMSAELSNAFFLVIGFYFSRTNHVNIGGIGPKTGRR